MDGWMDLLSVTGNANGSYINTVCQFWYINRVLSPKCVQLFSVVCHKTRYKVALCPIKVLWLCFVFDFNFPNYGCHTIPFLQFFLTSFKKPLSPPPLRLEHLVAIFLAIVCHYNVGFYPFVTFFKLPEQLYTYPSE